MRLEELWDDFGPETVIVGEVTDGEGRVLDVRRLIQRRWGWPKRAAFQAADYLEGHGDLDGASLPIRGPKLAELQDRIFYSNPDILRSLLDGVAARSQREARNAGRTYYGVDIDFTEEVEDEGFVTNILYALSTKMGTTVDKLRKVVHFSDQEGYLRIEVQPDALEPVDG